MTHPRMNLWNSGGMFLMGLIILLAAASLYVHPVKQRDFLGIYTAVSAFTQGQDPYGTTALPPVEGQAIAAYVYPPYTLYLFKPFTWFNFPTAARIFLTLKLLAIAGLILLWHRLFNLDRYQGFLWLLIPLAFSGTLIADIRAGNISIFEQLMIWTGFYFYTRGKMASFGAAITAAATIKLTPILLLGLLATKGSKKEMAWGAFWGVVFCVFIGGSAMVWPHLFENFLRNVRGLQMDRGEYNPSSWALACDAARWLKTAAGGSVPAIIAPGIYGIFTVVALVVSAKCFVKLRAWEGKAGDLWRICLWCFLFALMVPRFKNYSYILLIAPSLYVLAHCQWVNAIVPLGALLTIYSYQNLQFLGTIPEPFYRVQREYDCLVLAWVFWGLCCYCARREVNLCPSENGISR